MSIPDSAPVLVGVAAVQQKCTDPTEAKEAIALMHDAVDMALQDCGAPAIAKDIQLISIPKGMWGYSNPAALIAEHIEASNCETEFADFGILQQTNLGKACSRIACGELDVALVVGGEAKYRNLQAVIQQVSIDETVQTDSKPDNFLQPDAELYSEIETNAGLGMPVGYYAMIESAICEDRGISMDTHRDNIAARYARFSEIAAENPDGWIDQPVDAETIRNASGKNRMLAFPYTKMHNSQWNVDQACALLFCSVAKAREMGIPESQWVWPLASTESNQMINVPQRPDLASSAGARIAGQRALELAKLSIDDINFFEFYSCFPAAVNLYAKELGIEDNRDVTVCGAMPFAGGPLNNFFLQASVKMAKTLRANPGSYGLASCVSGMFTKQGYGIWSSGPYQSKFCFEDVTEQVKQQEKPLELIEPAKGSVTILGCTVLYEGDTPNRFVAVCEYGDSTRTASYSTDTVVIERALAENLVGQSADIDNSGLLSI